MAISARVRPMRSASAPKTMPPSRGGQQRDGHQQPRRIESEAELPLQGRDGHQVDDEIEGIERPSRLRRQEGLPLLGGERAIPGAGRLSWVDGVCSWPLAGFRPWCPLRKRRQWVKLVVSVFANRRRLVGGPSGTVLFWQRLRQFSIPPSRRTWQKIPKRNSSRWTSATANGLPRCIAATRKRPHRPRGARRHDLRRADVAVESLRRA